MIRKHDYFRLGAFIILGTVTFVAIVVILGAGRYFETSYVIESYFNESINGLEVGSPVKLRGVQVGRVADIDFVANKYNAAADSEVRYVYVKCEITTQLFREMNHETFPGILQQEVQRGLRIRPTSLGLTGQLFLNCIYAEPKANKPLTIDWTPKHSYVPSMPSTMNRIEQAVNTISSSLSKISQEDVAGIIRDVKSIVGTVEHFMNAKGGQEAGEKIMGILNSVHSILVNVDAVMADPALKRIVPEAAGAVSGANRIINASADDIISAAKEANTAMANLRDATGVLAKIMNDPRMDAAMDNVVPALQNITRASEDMSASVIKIHALVNRLNAVVATEESNIHAIMESTREVMENVRELTGDAKRYPSAVFFGSPPNQVTPDAKQPEQ